MPLHFGESGTRKVDGRVRHLVVCQENLTERVTVLNGVLERTTASRVQDDAVKSTKMVETRAGQVKILSNEGHHQGEVSKASIERQVDNNIR